jgi:hypothetical protein
MKDALCRAIPALAAEHLEIAGMRVALQNLLNLGRQAVHAAPHVGVPSRQPHPHTRGDRDRRDRALTTAAANAAGTDLGMRAQTFPANSISIAGSVQHVAPFAGFGAGLSAISAWAKPAAATRNSCRQRQI